MSDNHPLPITSFISGGSRKFGGRMPLTRAQLSIWLAQMLDSEDPTLSLAESVEFLGAFDTQKFETALRRIVAATDALHLQFIETDDGPRQFFDYRADWELTRLDFSRGPDPKEAADAWILRDLKRPFRFDGAPLFRSSLIKLSANHHYWYGTTHHALIDGAGWQMFLSRVAAAYSGLIEGKSREAAAGGSWLEVLADEQAYITSDRFRRDREFWRAHLAKTPSRVTLSGRPARRASGLIKTIGWIPRPFDLQEVARNYGAGSAAVLAAATAIYTHLTTGQRELLVGVLVSARVGPTMRAVIGNVANKLPLQITVGPDDRVGDVIRKVARDVRAAMRHQRYRIEDIRRDLGLKPSDGELASTVINFLPDNNDIELADCKTLRNTLSAGRVEDFHVLFHGGDALAGHRVDFVANPELYSEEELHGHRDRYLDLLSQVASADAETKVHDLKLSTQLFSASDNGDALTSDREARNVAPPRTPTEISVARIWSDVLRVSSISRGDNFFDIGGDSLLANMVTTRVRKAFALDLQLGVLFEAPTLMAFAGRIDVATGEGFRPEPAIPPVAIDAPAPLSFSQHRMWLNQSLAPENSAYNISGALQLNGSLDVEALSQAIAEVYGRHEILRTAYDLVSGEIVQRLQNAASAQLSIVDLVGLCPDDPATEALRRTYALASAPIDLSRGPGFNVTLMRIAPDKHLLQMTVHHIASRSMVDGRALP